MALPKFHILSQVEAAAVTLDVSLMAVPAKIPNASPCMVSKPNAFPRIGKKIAANTLKKKITAIDWAISSSSASITGAVAAMAEPPQIDDPTPTSIDVFVGTFKTFFIIHASTSEIVIVQTMIGKDCFPVSKITPKFIPKPSNTTAVCKITLEVHLIPASEDFLSFQNIAIIIPARIAITAPPITGNIFPIIHDGIAINRQIKMPFPYLLIKFIQ